MYIEGTLMSKSCNIALEAILRDVMGEEKFYFSLFPSFIYVMTLVVTVF